MRSKVFALVLGIAVVAASAAARPGPLYSGAARTLAPTAAQAGFSSITSAVPRALSTKPKPGLASVWTIKYATGTTEAGILSIQVFHTAAAAHQQYTIDCATGCSTGIDPAGWRFKLLVSGDPNGYHTVSVVSACQNVIAGMTHSSSVSVGNLTKADRNVIDLVFNKAISVGCKPAQEIPTKKVYWTESHAEQAVVHTLRVPFCWLYPDETDCARFPGYHPATAHCTGADELGSSFTFSRFDCTIEVDDPYGRDIGDGHVAVYPTGPSAFVWKLLD